MFSMIWGYKILNFACEAISYQKNLQSILSWSPPVGAAILSTLLNLKFGQYLTLFFSIQCHATKKYEYMKDIFCWLSNIFYKFYFYRTYNNDK